MTLKERPCPGCGLRMPVRHGALYDGYYHTSPECWAVFTEVLGAEYGNVTVFGQVHQLTVDAYAVQHAGGRHPDKSVGIHLCGLHLALEEGVKPPTIAPMLHRLAESVETWPHFPPPGLTRDPTVLDVALAGSAEEHVAIARRWARTVWADWSAYHADVAALVSRHLGVRGEGAEAGARGV